MAWISTLSTDGVAPDQRVDYWNAAACSALVAQCADPHDKARFSGRMRCGDIGDIRAVELGSTAATIWHSREHVARAAGEHFLLRVQRSGESHTSQDGREVRLRTGDFTLCDAQRPYRLHFTEPASFLTLRISRTALRRYFGAPEQLVLLRVPGDAGLGLVASRLLSRVANSFDVVVNPLTYPRLSSAVLEIVAGAFAGQVGAPIGAGRHSAIFRAKIIEFVESRLADASLTPTSVAQEFGISRRYLHGLFEAGEETLARYIWRRRLECARYALLDARRTGRTLTQLAEEHGFKTLAHFSRNFRAAFGHSPKELRSGSRA
jgi:AraC-like DNA-binding protein